MTLQVEQKYNEIKSRSGILTIVGKEFYCDKSDIEELSDLGRGAFGAVRKARCKKTNTLMAVKVSTTLNFASEEFFSSSITLD